MPDTDQTDYSNEEAFQKIVDSTVFKNPADPTQTVVVGGEAMSVSTMRATHSEIAESELNDLFQGMRPGGVASFMGQLRELISEIAKREIRDQEFIGETPIPATTAVIAQLRECKTGGGARILYEFIPHDGNVLPVGMPRFQGVTRASVKVGKFKADSPPLPFVFNADSIAEAWATYDQHALAAQKAAEDAIKREMLAHPERLPRQGRGIQA